MKRSLLPLFLAVLLPFPGCLVTKKKYNELKLDRDRLTGLLDQRDSELVSAQDEFRRRLESTAAELDLYKKQAGDSKTEADKARQELEKVRAMTKQFEDQLRALNIGEVRDGRLILQDTLLFQLGSDKLSADGMRALDKVAGVFKGKEVLIQIDGHTDTTPVARAETKRAHVDNMGLGAHRALAVYRHLAAKGIPERSIYVRSFGPSWPVASNATPASKARNRRVEILFIPASMVPRPSAK
jgi:chemotaxis protein MotB